MQLTSSTILVLVVLLVIYLSLSVPTLLRLFRRTRLEEISPEWLDSFSPAIYLPMERLLNREDFAFLSSQPGFDLSLQRKLRNERLKIFRQYLDRMIIDFNRLHMAARLAISQSAGDHSHLLPRLVALKFRFAASVLFAEFRYSLCWLGINSLSARALLLELQEMSSQLQLARLPA